MYSRKRDFTHLLYLGKQRDCGKLSNKRENSDATAVAGLPRFISGQCSWNRKIDSDGRFVNSLHFHHEFCTRS